MMEKILMSIVPIMMILIVAIMIGIFGFMVVMLALNIGLLVLLVVGIAILLAPMTVAISVPASFVLPNSSLPQVEYYIDQQEGYSNYAIEGNWKWMGCSIQSNSRGTFEEVKKMEDRLVMISKLCNWNVKKKTSWKNEKDEGAKDGGEFRYNKKL